MCMVEILVTRVRKFHNWPYQWKWQWKTFTALLIVCSCNLCPVSAIPNGMILFHAYGHNLLLLLDNFYHVSTFLFAGNRHGNTVEIYMGEESMVFPFNPNETVGDLMEMIETESSKQCKLLNQGTIGIHMSVCWYGAANHIECLPVQDFLGVVKLRCNLWSVCHFQHLQQTKYYLTCPLPVQLGCAILICGHMPQTNVLPRI